MTTTVPDALIQALISVRDQPGSSDDDEPRHVDPASLDSGKEGLPDEVLVSDKAHGISVIDGQIIATWMKDETDLDGVTYILNPEIENGAVEWTVTGTCRRKKACK